MPTNKGLVLSTDGFYGLEDPASSTAFMGESTGFWGVESDLTQSLTMFTLSTGFYGLGGQFVPEALTDAAIAADTVDPGRAITESLTDAAVAGDQVDAALSALENLSDAAVAGDTLDQVPALTESLTDAALAGDVVDDVLSLGLEQLTDAAVAGDAVGKSVAAPAFTLRGAFQVELWSGVEAEGGERLDILTRFHVAQETMRLGQLGHLGQEELLMIIPMSEASSGS